VVLLAVLPLLAVPEAGAFFPLPVFFFMTPPKDLPGFTKTG
jgi:hypothetical protein